MFYKRCVIAQENFSQRTDFEDKKTINPLTLVTLSYVYMVCDTIRGDDKSAEPQLAPFHTDCNWWQILQVALHHVKESYFLSHARVKENMFSNRC